MKRKVIKHITIFACIFIIIAAILFGTYRYFFYPYRGVSSKIEYSQELYTMLTKDQAIKDLDYIIKTLSERHPACMNGLPELVLQVYQKEKEELISAMERAHLTDLR